MEILKKFKEKAASDVQKIIFAEGEELSKLLKLLQKKVLLK